MSLYLKQIEQLVALQRIDSEILELHRELDTAPREVVGLEAEFDDLDQQRQQLVEKVNYLKEQESRLSLEIEDDSLRIKKSKNKLMMVSNNKEYHAMMREMDNLEKLNRLREEERLALAEELQRQNEALEELDVQVNAVKTQLDARRSSLKNRMDLTMQRLDELKRQRKDAGRSVPGPVLGRYEFIRSRLAAPVIVRVKGGVCEGCHISIPPQSYNELQKGEQILSCPNCQRLIYWCEHFTPDEPETPEVQAETDEELHAVVGGK